MTNVPASLETADWFKASHVGRTFALLDQGGQTARIVGGAVRDGLAGLPVKEVDFATPLTPDVVAERASSAGIRAVPTGLAHGTVTLVVDDVPVQVTTLREDVETDGRHAVVRFGVDWEADARRRDFTVNALSVDASGRVHDPLAGWPDIVARRVRFIGDPDKRIAEDRLRILRFFRFNAQFGDGDFDRLGLSASIRARDGLRQLSAERVGQEMRRLMAAPRNCETLSVMQDCGVLGVVLAGVAYLGPLARLLDFLPSASRPLRLAAAGCRIEEDVGRLATRLRLSNAESDSMLNSVVAARRFDPVPRGKAAKRLLYRLGSQQWVDAVALAFAWSTAPPDEAAWLALRRLPDEWEAPIFPLRGADALGLGVAAGPAVGSLLNTLEEWWIENDFVPDEKALRARLQQMATAAQ